MEVSDEKLDAAIRYMRAEDVAEDPYERGLIRSMYIAAVLYLRKAGIEEPAEDPELYYLAVHSLTLHYYDHRDAVSSEAPIPIGLRPIINQLKLDGIINAAI